ncbi:Nn.00g103360.m01.CDS01 [Neocucurbitaria sp. VM-36]
MSRFRRMQPTQSRQHAACQTPFNADASSTASSMLAFGLPYIVAYENGIARTNPMQQEIVVIHRDSHRPCRPPSPLAFALALELLNNDSIIAIAKDPAHSSTTASPESRSLAGVTLMPRLGHKKYVNSKEHTSTILYFSIAIEILDPTCDELKPCSNCVRHGAPCSLITWDPDAPQLPPPPTSTGSGSAPELPRQTSTDQPKSSPASTSSSSLPIDYVLNPPNRSPGRDEPPVSAISDDSSPKSQPDQFPFLTRFIHRSEKSQSDIWVRDLELMHHWTVEAFDQLSQRDDMRHTWRVEAPKHAVAHPFLMHEILAFAAFHKAHQHPNQRAVYYAFGIHHQDLAIRGIREKLHNVLPQEAAPIVATSTLLTLTVFASTGFEASCLEMSTPQSPIDAILNIFSLMQGLANVLAISETSVTDSFLAPMFRDPREAVASQPLLQELVEHMPTLVTFIEGKRDLPEPERKSYLGEIAHFEPVLQVAMPPRVDNRELRFLFFWPVHLEAEFIAYVRQRRPGALVVLMYYATMLFASEPRYWFMEGWGDRLMRSCYECVDQSWMPSIQWPISFLNQNATYDIFANLVRQRQAREDQSHTPYTQRPLVPASHQQYHPTALPPQEQKFSTPCSKQTSRDLPRRDVKPVVGKHIKLGELPHAEGVD